MERASLAGLNRWWRVARAASAWCRARFVSAAELQRKDFALSSVRRALSPSTAGSPDTHRAGLGRVRDWQGAAPADAGRRACRALQPGEGATKGWEDRRLASQVVQVVQVVARRVHRRERLGGLLEPSVCSFRTGRGHRSRRARASSSCPKSAKGAGAANRGRSSAYPMFVSCTFSSARTAPFAAASDSTSKTRGSSARAPGHATT